MDSSNIILIIIVIVVLAVVGFVIYTWFMGAGGGQSVLPSFSLGISSFTNSIKNNLFVREFTNVIQNPWGVNPNKGEYEETKEKTPPNQAFTVKLTGTSGNVMLNQSAILVNIQVENKGSYTLRQVDITLDMPYYPGCLINKNGNIPEVTIDNIAPHAIKSVTLSGLKINGGCIADALHREIIEKRSVSGLNIKATATSYYVTSSRLAIVRIKEGFADLLLRNNVLKQEDVGAVYRTGSAVVIDMSTTQQPIFEEVKTAPILMSWKNVGSGTIPDDKTPVLFIITPYIYGRCIPEGFPRPYLIKAYTENGANICKIATNGNEGDCDGDATSTVKSKCGWDTSDLDAYYCVVCDNALKETWCKEDSVFFNRLKNYAPSAEDSFKWACGLIDEKDNSNNPKFHVCATTSMTSEFNVFSCSLDLSRESLGNENFKTEYVTTLALYPYSVTSNDLVINGYCLSTQGDWCITKEEANAG